MSVKDTGLAVLLAIACGIIATLGFALLPVQAAGGISCKSPLKGSAPTEKATKGFLVGREEKACSDKGGSRLTIVLIGGAAFTGLMVAAVALPQSNFERVAFNDEDPEDVYEMPNF